MFLRFLPIWLSAIVLAAHFLRGGYSIFMIVCLLFPLLLYVKRRWAARLIQIFLWLGAAEWVLTTVTLIAERQMRGEAYGRMVLILGTVALLTAASSFVFRGERMRQRFGFMQPPEAQA